MYYSLRVGDDEGNYETVAVLYKPPRETYVIDKDGKKYKLTFQNYGKTRLPFLKGLEKDHRLIKVSGSELLNDAFIVGDHDVIIDEFIKKGKINRKNGNDLLVKAVENDDVLLYGELTDHGIRPTKSDNRAVLKAVETGNIYYLRDLINLGANYKLNRNEAYKLALKMGDRIIENYLADFRGIKRKL